MSRLAKKPIVIPDGVTLRRDSDCIIVKGDKGEMRVRILPFVDIALEAQNARVTPTGTSRQARANVGTAWSLMRSAIEGVTRGFSKRLVIEGVGYRAVMEGNEVVLSLGYVLPVRFPVPRGVSLVVEKNTITISGTAKELVGKVAAEIRALKKPEPYKGKGIRYEEEIVRRKAGKKAVATSG